MSSRFGERGRVWSDIECGFFGEFSGSCLAWRLAMLDDAGRKLPLSLERWPISLYYQHAIIIKNNYSRSWTRQVEYVGFADRAVPACVAIELVWLQFGTAARTEVGCVN